MPCTATLSGLARDCQTSKGGIVMAYIANFSDVASVSVSSDKISGITMQSGKKFKKYYFRQGTGSLTKTLTSDPSNGVSFWTSELLLQMNRMDTTKRVELAALQAADLVALVKDANGSVWYLGFEEPVVCSAGDGATGAARSDANRYTCTLQDNCSFPPYEVNVGDGTGQVDLDEISE